MKSETLPQPKPWADSIAMGLSMVCAVHCLVTPILIAVLPLLASSFLVHKDFHLWMLLLVVPLAAGSLFLGCRKHKSNVVMACGILGVSLLIGAAVAESFSANAGIDGCAHCAALETSGFWTPLVLTNLLAGFFLICAHSRNFLLCRKAHCACG